jgi:hypothetical protein
MKTKKTIITIAALTASITISQASLTFSTPSATSATGSSTPDTLTIDAGAHKTYTVTGYQINHGNTNKGLTITASINGKTIFADFEVTKQGGITTVSALTSAIVISDASAVLKLEYSGEEAPKNGVSVEIFAEVVDNTVEPTGNLEAPLLAADDGEELPMPAP